MEVKAKILLGDMRTTSNNLFAALSMVQNGLQSQDIGEIQTILETEIARNDRARSEVEQMALESV